MVELIVPAVNASARRSAGSGVDAASNRAPALAVRQLQSITHQRQMRIPSRLEVCVRALGHQLRKVSPVSRSTSRTVESRKPLDTTPWRGMAAHLVTVERPRGNRKQIMSTTQEMLLRGLLRTLIEHISTCATLENRGRLANRRGSWRTHSRKPRTGSPINYPINLDFISGSPCSCLSDNTFSVFQIGSSPLSDTIDRDRR